jgi:TolB-like protein
VHAFSPPAPVRRDSDSFAGRASLEDLVHDPDQDYFADGMTEALITRLVKISALRVISRTSAMQYKGVRRA